MTGELQDLAWQCLPKEVRDFIKCQFLAKSDCPDYEEGYNQSLIDLFGHHNLTSDTEPEEIICVNKERFDNFYKLLEHCYNHDSTLYDDLYWKFVECLPDKDPMKIDAADSLIAMTKDEMDINDKEPSVQVEPKFKVGDKVRFEYSKDSYSRVQEIKDIRIEDGVFEYQIGAVWAKEPYIIPYTEPEAKDNMNKLSIGTLIKYNGDVYKITGYDGYADEYGYKVKVINPVDDEYPTAIAYAALFEVMENQELNLCELLQGYKGEEYWSPTFGKITLHKTTDNNIQFRVPSNANTIVEFYSDGLYNSSGVCQVFPSMDLYEKYPLDPYSAWMEWKSERTPKRWRADKGEMYWWIDDELNVAKCTESNDRDNDANYEVGNYFRTEEEAIQAAEAVKECLMKFHEQNK